MLGSKFSGESFNLGEVAIYRSCNSLKQQFIEVAIHQSGNSSKQQFIERLFHRMHKLI
jgi:hypothetical protein